MMERERRWPWIAQQEWRDVLFLHWPVSADKLRPLIPAPFELDTFDDKAWISIVLFQARNSRLRGMPRLFSYPNFLQVNVRTYVTFNDEPGVYFLSIEANRFLVVKGAKNVLGLPYQQATMQLRKDKKKLLFESKRRNPKTDLTHIYASYEPSMVDVPSYRGTLPFWLTERYCLWMKKGKKIIKGRLSHERWNLHAASIDTELTGYPSLFSLPCDEVDPLVHYAASIHAHLHPFEQKGIYVREDFMS